MKNDLCLLAPSHLIEKSSNGNTTNVGNHRDGKSAQDNKDLFPPWPSNDQGYRRRQRKKYQQHAETTAGFGHSQGPISEHNNVPFGESRTSQRLQNVSTSLRGQALQRLP